jgi:succinate dehydrogenase/fumarate reductase-like Fe-S protein
MAKKIINVTVRRYDPSEDSEGHNQTYSVPIDGEMAVLQVLDYIYEHLDNTLAYRDDGACAQGICRQCTLLINDKPSLMCQTIVDGDISVAPPSKFKVVKDLVYVRKGGSRNEQ